MSEPQATETPTEPPAPEAPPTETPAAPEAAWPEDWRTQMAGGDDKVAKRLERFSAPGDLATAYTEADAAINSGRFGDKIALPGKDATPEDLAAFRQALPEQYRPPESADGYKITHPEWSMGEVGKFDDSVQERITGVVAKLHESGASNAVVQAMFDSYWDLVAADTETIQAADKRYLEGTEAALKKEWGPDYKKNDEYADRALTSIFGAEFEDMELKGGQTLKTVPEFRKAMAKIGRMLGEDEMIGGVRDPDAQKDIQTKIDDLTKSSMDDGSYNTPATQAKIQELYKSLHGTVPADGRQAA